jgi:hypothetical protein
MVTECDARQALMALGIVPTKALVRNWMLAGRAEEEQVGRESPPTPPAQTVGLRADARPNMTKPYRPPPSRHPRGYSKSRLEPLLRAQGALERRPGIRRRGRPRITASWFTQVAEAMADGTSLKAALARNGITGFSKSQIRACYRNRTLRAIYKEARRQYLAQHRTDE